MKPAPSKAPAAVELRRMQHKPSQGQTREQATLAKGENNMVVAGNQGSKPKKVETRLVKGVEEGITNGKRSSPPITLTEIEHTPSSRYIQEATNNCCQRCFALCEVETSFLLLLTIILGGILMFGIFGLYTLFQYWHRAYALWFFVFAILAWLLAFSFILKHLRAAYFGPSPEVKDETVSIERVFISGGRRKQCLNEIWRARDAAKRLKDDYFDVNGEHYLLKMFLSESLENAFMIRNFLHIYICSMPLPVYIVVSFVCLCEVACCTWSALFLNSQVMRDRQLLLDVLTDIFCLSFPLAYMYWGSRLRIPLRDILYLVGPRCCYCYLKLMIFGTIYLHSMYRDCNKAARRTKGKRKSRRRRSILSMYSNKQIVAKQVNNFPPFARIIVVTTNTLAFLFILVVTCLHIATQPSDAQCNAIFNEEVWGSCTTKVPFCYNVFVARCDCAVLSLKNYSRQALPVELQQMRSLLKLEIIGGRLSVLPESIGKANIKLQSLIATRTNISTLPDSITKLPMLLELYVFNNKIVKLPRNIGDIKTLTYLQAFGNRLSALPASIGDLTSLEVLGIQNNQITELPDSLANVASLRLLYIFNNNITDLPTNIGNLGHLTHLYAYNNRIRRLPESMLQLGKLNAIMMWGNNLTALPSNIGTMKRVVNLDVRHNQLRALPGTFESMTSLRYFQITGNPVCSDLNFRTAKKIGR